jgi:hypothetical protein
VIREEQWPEVFVRPWPDGDRGAPRFLGIFKPAGEPVTHRIVVRRADDGRPLVRLHERKPLFNHTAGIFDGDDVRIGYCRWPFKMGHSPWFDIVLVDHRRFAEFRPTSGGVHRLTGDGGADRGTVTLCEGRTARVTAGTTPPDNQGDVFLLAAALSLLRFGLPPVQV